VSEQDFVAAQKVTARTQPADGSRRTYLLVVSETRTKPQPGPTLSASIPLS
jgi:hypothetical protein